MAGSYPYYNDDPTDPHGKRRPRNMWDNGALQGIGGMFSGLRQNYLMPNSNKLLLGGLGMLGSGPEGAMKGLVAGSAMDTSRKRERALQGLMKDPNSILSKLSPGDQAFVSSDPDLAGQVIAEGMKPADSPGSWDEYIRTTSNPTEEGYDAFLKRRGAQSGVNINMNQLPAEMGARIGMGDAFLDELNVSMAGGPSIRTRIETVFGGDNAAKARAQLAAGMGEPAAIWRRIETGKESLIRNLTGAGMSMSEAEQHAKRYSISSMDSVETMISKMDGLERDLNATREGALGARKGTLGNEEPAPSGANDDPLGLR